MAYLPAGTPIAYRLPFLGRIAREIAEGDADNKWYLIAGLLSAIAAAVLTWGLPALVVSAVAAVPVCFVMLVLITRG